MKILAIFTCFNRRELTERGMATLSENKNVTFDLNFIASLQRLPAGRKCNPVGFLIIIFCATTFITSFRLYIYQCDELSEPLFPVFPDDEPPVPVLPDPVSPVVEPEAVPVPSVPVVPPPSPSLPITI